MKQLIFTVIALACITTTHAQEILFDETHDGFRTVATDSKNVRSTKDKMVLHVGLSAIIGKFNGEPRTTMTLDLTITNATKIYVKQGDALTLTLTDGTTINLTACVDDDHGMVGDIHNVNGMVYYDYTTRPAYEITKEQITEIATKGVSSIYCETRPLSYRKEFKKDKIGAAIAERWTLLKNYLHL